MKQNKASIFDILKNITFEKNHRFIDFSSVYNQYMINLYLMLDESTLLFANELNVKNLTDRQHYEYLLYALPKRKIFFKWEKKIHNKELGYIQKEYKCNLSVAKDYLRLLPQEDLNEIIEKYENY